jgi:DNA-binding transcriptional ArsR family regulator
MQGKSMRELCESDELKTFFDRRLIEALGHPVREHILAVLNERIASASEIGEEIGADVSSFYHHVEELEKFGCIERVKSEQRRGGREHFFRAKRTVFFSDEDWRQMPESLREDVAVSSLQLLFDDVLGALSTGMLDARDDRHVSWTPGSFDAQGWNEVMGLMNRTLDQLGRIQDAAERRLAEGNSPEISATMAILAFETGPRRDAS